jgi:hypothetical protein
MVITTRIQRIQRIADNTHERVSTTIESYAKPEAVTGARQRRALTVLAGGAA